MKKGTARSRSKARKESAVIFIVIGFLLIFSAEAYYYSIHPHALTDLFQIQNDATPQTALAQTVSFPDVTTIHPGMLIAGFSVKAVQISRLGQSSSLVDIKFTGQKDISGTYTRNNLTDNTISFTAYYPHALPGVSLYGINFESPTFTFSNPTTAYEDLPLSGQEVGIEHPGTVTITNPELSISEKNGFAVQAELVSVNLSVDK